MLALVDDERPIAPTMLRKLQPVPQPQPIPPADRLWTDEEWAAIKRGHKSRDMDDKWHAFAEERRLYLHRSSTGRGVYEAKFDADPKGWRITSAVVAGDGTSYRRRGDEFEGAFLAAVIEYKLGVHDGPGHSKGLRELRRQRQGP
jgi:hypothetical protein